MKYNKKKKNYLVPIMQFFIILLIGFGFIYFVSKIAPIRPQTIEIEIPAKMVECQCLGLDTEDVGLICSQVLRQEFVSALQFNYATDDALGKPTLVPLLKEIVK